MINDDILIKFSRQRGHKEDWPQHVRFMRNRLYDLKLGFPGLKNDHIDLVLFQDIGVGDYFIVDPYLEMMDIGDKAPKMFKLLENGMYSIEGIGIGLDLDDPDRRMYRYKDIIPVLPFNNINGNSLCIRINVRPDLTGGPGYYYFYKSYRDFRM